MISMVTITIGRTSAGSAEGLELSLEIRGKQYYWKTMISTVANGAYRIIYCLLVLYFVCCFERNSSALRMSIIPGRAERQDI
ncbi:hypothetical protein I7I50_02516 [Histoplasma capsulatum G186AR]|uniref:Uncharacterized protein n=1 Tax=Ajellomyces capsulatus TaxID=5037 RepID=A0A8H7Z362_AJECA|nr:hypothetical protein I7I52_00820 [Histoplasma capsulatum]QSS71608.1 hypothetical protein I7I50_02516 [Histoplasma capsulatum G186AR]